MQYLPESLEWIPSLFRMVSGPLLRRLIDAYQISDVARESSIPGAED
jgi:hypothetical protein